MQIFLNFDFMYPLRYNIEICDLMKILGARKPKQTTIL